MSADGTTSQSIPPVPFQKGSYKMFSVPTYTFMKFKRGKIKYERWKKYLDEEDEHQCGILDYACKNPSKDIVLRDQHTGCMKAIRRNRNA